MAESSKFRVVGGERILMPSPYKRPKPSHAREQLLPVRGGARMLPDDRKLSFRDPSRPVVLVPPGIGDTHWFMLKMQSMTERWFGGARPEIRALSEMDPSYNRAHEYLRRLPFVHCGEYAQGIIYLAGAMLAHDIIVAGDGFDLAIMASQHVEAGKRIEDWYSELDTNWDYEVLETEEDRAFGERFLQQRGPFVLLTFFNGGYYPETKLQMSDERKVAIVQKLKEALPHCEMILTGGWWDRDYHQLLVQMGMPATVSSGETGIGELFALMRRATAWVGHQAGNTMMAQHLRCPTVLYWSTMWRNSPRVRHLEDAMWTCWVERDRIGRTYDAIEMSQTDDVTVASVMRSIQNDGRDHGQPTVA